MARVPSHLAHLRVTSDFVPGSQVFATPNTATVMYAPRSFEGHTPKHSGLPAWDALCSCHTHLWATAVLVPHCEVLRTPTAGLCRHQARLWAIVDFVPRSKALGTPRLQGLCRHEAHLWVTAHRVFCS